MPSVVSYVGHLDDSPFLINNNQNDLIFKLRKTSLQLFHVPTLQISNRLINVDATPVGIDYSNGISSLVSCTQDGQLYIWDVRDKNSHANLQSNRQFSDTTFTSCAISNDGSLLCCGTELTKVKYNSSLKHTLDLSSSDDDDKEDRKSKYAYLVYWDSRFLLSPLGVHKDMHTDDITDLKFDSTSVPGYQRLLSCAEDGLVCLLDLNASKESRAILQIFNSESIPTSCDWLISPTCSSIPRGIYCTTTMQTNVKMWPLIPKLIEPIDCELELDDFEEKELDVRNQIWNKKLGQLNGHKYFRIKCLSDNDFVLLGESNGCTIGPVIFSCYDHVSQYPLDKFDGISECCHLSYADFIGSPTNGFCVFANASSLILCSCN